MKSILIKKFLIFIFLTQVACNSLSESKRILTNQRVNTTDEFLIEKKELWLCLIIKKSLSLGQ